MIIRTLAILATLVLTAGAQAQDRYALVGGTLIDGNGGQPIRNSVILVEGERIVRVGNTDTVEVPDGYEVISTEAMTVLPGLWEMHAHLMLNGHADYDHWHPTYMDRMEDEIMPASAVQLLLAGVTTARDLGAPLEMSLSIRDRINDGVLPGPRLFVSGPFLQHRTRPGAENYRWGINGEREARARVNELADAGVDVIKLIDQDEMTLAEATALVDQAHQRGLRVVAHSHRPNEILRGLEIGVDNFEHTGLTTAPEYPDHVMDALVDRTARGRISGGPLFWTPTIEGLWNYSRTRDNPERLDTDCWHRGLQPDTIADIAASIEHPDQLTYMQLTPLRAPTLRRKFEQLREAGVVLMVGTDSGIPMKFHCQSTWNEIDVWTRELDVPVMDAIRAATYWPSVFMGVEDQWGRVQEGLYADIIAVDGDLLTYPNLLQDVDFVMKGGVVYVEDGQVNEEILPESLRME
ncbi:amidohydrolase family protein [Hyphobacterium marinum]|uniref:Amidohydrolase family protein n=1 Tax=Hyphobacterium marinum TaxID=3116574 RepID=A0ABU7LVI7_9PROT|nr:amidohydrolase family protein [Hyphobacterium sp. Y6023]MEE2565571.1 amidohydrolase family protein [Hyphobacterium sp. Y6023]